AQKGHGQQALNFFRLMELDGGASPDEITFVGILTACGHLGDLKEALRQFYSVTTDRKNLAITAEHYGCLIDILARLGHLGAAEDLFESMPFVPDRAARISLISACKLHKDSRRAVKTTERAIKQDPGHASSYVLLSNTYTQ
ncbi:hypothetical protein SELMODRAFT_7200, partial [Selaginella moellendorffii]